MPLYKLIWNSDEEQRGYSVANSIAELATKVERDEPFRGELTSIIMTNPFPMLVSTED